MSNLEKYTDLQADFYHYMVKFGGIAKKTSGDYVTRMKFYQGDGKGFNCEISNRTRNI